MIRSPLVFFADGAESLRTVQNTARFLRRAAELVRLPLISCKKYWPDYTRFMPSRNRVALKHDITLKLIFTLTATKHKQSGFAFSAPCVAVSRETHYNQAHTQQVGENRHYFKMPSSLSTPSTIPFDLCAVLINLLSCMCVFEYPFELQVRESVRGEGPPYLQKSIRVYDETQRELYKRKKEHHRQLENVQGDYQLELLPPPSTTTTIEKSPTTIASKKKLQQSGGSQSPRPLLGNGLHSHGSSDRARAVIAVPFPTMRSLRLA